MTRGAARALRGLPCGCLAISALLASLAAPADLLAQDRTSTDTAVVAGAAQAGREAARREGVGARGLVAAAAAAPLAFYAPFLVREGLPPMHLVVSGVSAAALVGTLVTARKRLPDDLRQQIRFWKPAEQEAFISAYENTASSRRTAAFLVGAAFGASLGFLTYGSLLAALSY